MKILILGSGGREHALAWAIKQNPKCDTLLCAPGNAGIAQIADCYTLDILDTAAVVDFAKLQNIDFVVIGPEAPLVADVGGALRAAGILTFGPSRAAAQLEASKNFTKKICAAAGVPTAAYAYFTDSEAAKAYVQMKRAPIVVKADGLAAGKGVFIAKNETEAKNAIEAIFSKQSAEPSAAVVIEEFMEGEEASLFVLCDGETAFPVGTAKDYKRAFDGDEGPNTGGMGAYSPTSVLNNVTLEKAMKRIIEPTLSALRQKGIPFQGVLYAGLMIKDGDPKLVEYNVRFGDPECQVLMMRLGAQALDLIEATALGNLANAQINWAEDFAVTIVMATKGYPGQYSKGSVIKGLDILPENSNSVCFHAGTSLIANELTATGGRVLNVSARGKSLKEARLLAYSMANLVDWSEGFFRKDIGSFGL